MALATAMLVNVEFCTNVYGPQRMNHTDFPDPLTFTVVARQADI